MVSVIAGRLPAFRLLSGALLAVAAALAGCAGAATPSGPPSGANLQKAEQMAREWMAARSFNGVILVDKKGEDLIALADGVADPDTGRPLTLETRFQTGSIEKYFASIAAFKMIDDGKLDLDAPISAYLPEYRPDTGAEITLRDLLSNQSGLPNDMRKAFQRAGKGEAAAVDAMDPAEAVAEYASGDLKFEPGAQFDYVLSNWLLVQHLLATVAGEAYPAVRARYVFGPAGMTESGGYIHDLTETDPPVADVAIGFDPDDPDGHGDYWSPRFFAGSYATARDMLKLERALASGALMAPASVALFRTVQAPEENYAFGGRYRMWAVCGEEHLVSTQSGSNGATNITSAYDVETGMGVSMLTNVDDSQHDMFALSHALMNIFGGCAAPE